MKKIFALVAIAVTVIALVAGCGSNNNAGSNDKKKCYYRSIYLNIK